MRDPVKLAGLVSFMSSCMCAMNLFAINSFYYGQPPDTNVSVHHQLVKHDEDGQELFIYSEPPSECI